MRKFVLAFVMMLSCVVWGQFTTPTIDGSIGSGEYGTHTNGQNQQFAEDRTFFLTWDETYLYVGVSGHTNFNDAIVLYMDIDPQVPVNSGSNSNGTLTGINYDGVTPTLPFRADFFAYVKSDYDDYKTDDGSGGWGTSTTNSLTKNFNAGNDVGEFRIPWSAITGSAKPSSFNWIGFMSYSGGGGGTFARVPTGNPSGTSPEMVRYYTVSSTANGSSTKPFSQDSYCHIGGDVSGFGAITVYDFTMNTGSATITRASGSGGVWNISNDLIIGNGSISFGTSSNAANITGEVVISSGATLTLGAFGGDLNIGGDFTNNGTFNCNDRAVTFNGTSAQNIGGSGSITIDYMTLNNSAGLTLNQNLSIDNSLTLTSGDINLNGKDITLGSSATLSETAGNTVKGTSGVIQTTRNLNAPSSLNVAGLGATITSSVDMGSTTIQRGHAERTGNANTSILRYYDISPTTNTGLNATLVFNYDDSELNSKTEANLVLFRSTNGTDWTYQGGNVNTSANTITLSGIDAFSLWTAGDSDNPLPVELTSFTARMTGTNVQLNWATASEIDNFGFQIERTLVTEGQDNTFSVIGFVEGKGTVYTPKEYTWVDNTVNRPGKYQYRLKQIDTDGDFEYSDAVEVVFEAPKSFELSQNYPNPFNPSTRISFTVPADSRVKISVFNAVGELIKVLEDGIREAGYHSVVFDAAGLPSGMYYYKLEAGDFVQSRKMLLIK